MTRVIATLAALALLAPAAIAGGTSGPDGAAGKDGKAPSETTDAKAQEEEALKELEQGFSIPAADGETKKKGSKK